MNSHPKVVVHVDGGSRGNPGPSASAAVAHSPDGQPLGERSEYLGEATNNVAEYKAVQLGIELARELGAGEIELVNDSQLVARQIGGEYKVKNKGLMPLFLETMEQLRQFDRWSVRDVRREQNERADELVNEELDRQAGGEAPSRRRAKPKLDAYVVFFRETPGMAAWWAPSAEEARRLTIEDLGDVDVTGVDGPLEPGSEPERFL